MLGRVQCKNSTELGCQEVFGRDENIFQENQPDLKFNHLEMGLTPSIMTQKCFKYKRVISQWLFKFLSSTEA